ncbi:hypothetical protein XY27_000818 [Salmonella enterica subsp. enterica]|nr:hypothetical protein [Salmonella enterica subsp. enterica serovar Virchow]EDS6602770.1 hypothetical protein [Salmonella enterica subsp. enterica serovar Kisangani]EDU9171461.1 hypothetical protein [Salmonella enterica subsp. enterica serovar Kisangani]
MERLTGFTIGDVAKYLREVKATNGAFYYLWRDDVPEEIKSSLLNIRPIAHANGMTSPNGATVEPTEPKPPKKYYIPKPRNTKFIEGDPCVRCGATLRYSTGKKQCVACKKRRGRALRERIKANKINE